MVDKRPNATPSEASPATSPSTSPSKPPARSTDAKVRSWPGLPVPAAALTGGTFPRFLEGGVTGDERILLQVLIKQRRWERYTVFARRFEAAALALSIIEDEDGARQPVAHVPLPEREFARWLRGEAWKLPDAATCRVLTHMFQIPAETLFRPLDSRPTAYPAPPATHDRYRALQRDARPGVRTRPTSETQPVSGHDLSDDISRIAHSYLNTEITAVYGELRALARRSFDVVDTPTPAYGTTVKGESSRREAYEAASAAHALLARASLDLADLEAARDQVRTAVLCAELAGSAARTAWARGTQALIAIRAGRPHEALRYAAGVEIPTPRAGTAHIRLSTIEAVAHAYLGRTGDALAALTIADDQRANLTTQTEDDAPGGALTFPIADQLRLAGRVYLLLDQPRHAQAESLLSASVDAYERCAHSQARRGEQALAYVDLAACRVGAGQVAAALEPLHLALDIAAVRPTPAFDARLRLLAGALAALPASSAGAGAAAREVLDRHLSGPLGLARGPLPWSATLLGAAGATEGGDVYL